MVVVYKIDRLTRSLTDFAKLVDRMDAAGCSFVSVTQAFNTASSMGRLTLNVLLSFAQFEREVTAERIRDKIAASKKKGLWMGGNTPLGYDPHPDPEKRTLVINREEAQTVRSIFELYDAHKSLSTVRREAEQLGFRSKHRPDRAGSAIGGSVLSNGQIQHILRNPVYVGRIRHKDQSYPGLHPPIIEEDLWTRVQSALDAARRSRGKGKSRGALLTGKVRDETGDLLTPTHTTSNNRRHRYYVSNRLIAGGPDPSGWRIRAAQLERLVLNAILDHLKNAADGQTFLSQPDARQGQALSNIIRDLNLEKNAAQIAGLLASGTLAQDRLRLVLDATALAQIFETDRSKIAPEILTIDLPFTPRRRGVETKIVATTEAAKPDPTLLRTLCKAHAWAQDLRGGRGIAEIAQTTGHSESFVRTRTQLAFLSPKIQRAILEGTHPPDLTVKRMMRAPIPLDWDEQERLYGVSST